MELGLVYKCYCPRKQTKGLPYPGTCREYTGKPGKQFALRIRTDTTPVGFTDAIQGDCYQDLLGVTGDYIVRRADGVFAYHLAVAVDDAWQGITHIVRGADLLDSTPKQIYLQALLGLPTPAYGHVPVAVDHHDKKISKRGGAVAALLDQQPARVLVEVLQFLGQAVEPGLTKSDTATVISWAIENWDISLVPKVRDIQIPTWNPSQKL
jgi:glutamyl-Q tRNA(Asp) synthetase